MQELWTDKLMERFSGFARGAKSEVLILSPFIKIRALEAIVAGVPHSNVEVITRWRTADILSGVCDLDIFEMLTARNIPLRVHQQLHMKGIARDGREMLVSTANITAAGLGDAPMPNVECATIVTLQEQDHRWLSQIRRDSTKVTRALFEGFRAHVARQPSTKHRSVEEFSFAPKVNENVFTVFDLPSIETPQRLLERLYEPELSHNFDDWESSVEDAKKYALPLPIESPVTAFPILRQNFFSKPVILALSEFITRRRYFGEIKQWLRQECFDAHMLVNAELIRRVRAVFNWMVALGNGTFVMRRPQFSECLVRL